MTKPSLDAIRDIVFNPRRCGNAEAAFQVISSVLERQVDIENYSQMDDKEARQVLIALRDAYPERTPVL